MMMHTATEAPRITPGVATLRTDFFKTLPREQTLGIYYSYTHTVADPLIDAHYIDYLAASRKHLGIAVHYLIKTDGTIEIARNPKTVGATGPKRYRKTHLLVGVVGGLDEATGFKADTLTDAQRHSIAYLEQAIADALNVELEIDDATVDWLTDNKAKSAKRTTFADRMLAAVHDEMTFTEYNGA